MKEIIKFTGRWTSSEKSRFDQALASGFKDWAEVSDLVVTRTKAQCRSHYQKMIIGNRITNDRAKNTKKPVKDLISIRKRENETQCEDQGELSPSSLLTEAESLCSVLSSPLQKSIEIEERMMDVEEKEFEEDNPEDYFESLRF
jgi:hypothetical protein